MEPKQQKYLNPFPRSPNIVVVVVVFNPVALALAWSADGSFGGLCVLLAPHRFRFPQVVVVVAPALVLLVVVSSSRLLPACLPACSVARDIYF